MTFFWQWCLWNDNKKWSSFYFFLPSLSCNEWSNESSFAILESLSTSFLSNAPVIILLQTLNTAHDSIIYFRLYMSNILINCIICAFTCLHSLSHLNILLSSVMRSRLAYKLLIDLSPTVLYAFVNIFFSSWSEYIFSFKVEIEWKLEQIEKFTDSPLIVYSPSVLRNGFLSEWKNFL